MALISQAKHNFFLEVLEGSIKKFQELNSHDFTSQKIVTELQKEKNLLENIYSEFETTTRQLRTLIIQYEKAQRKTRIKLRFCQQLYLKQ